MVVVAVLLAVVAVPSTAWAFWTSAGTGVGTAVTGTLDAPTDVRAAATASEVTVTWKVPGEAMNEQLVAVAEAALHTGLPPSSSTS